MHSPPCLYARTQHFLFIVDHYISVISMIIIRLSYEYRLLLELNLYENITNGGQRWIQVGETELSCNLLNSWSETCV